MNGIYRRIVCTYCCRFRRSTPWPGWRASRKERARSTSLAGVRRATAELHRDKLLGRGVLAVGEHTNEQ